MRCSPAMAHCIRCDVLLCGHMVVIWYCSENWPGMYPVQGVMRCGPVGHATHWSTTAWQWAEGRWAREIGGSLTKWTYYSPGASSVGIIPPLIHLSLSPKSEKISPLCAMPMSPQVPSRSWGGLGKEILCENKKANCPADEPQQLMICLISVPSPVALGPAASSQQVLARWTSVALCTQLQSR